MRVSARTRANRANAKRSTGPKTKEGLNRSARNAHRHGLSIPAGILPEYSPAVNAYIELIVGESASKELRAAARVFAEAQTDIDRVRRARLALYADEDARTKKLPVREQLKTAIGLLDLQERIEAIPDDQRPIYELREGLLAVQEFLATFRLRPEVPTLEAGMDVLASKLAKLWRYERRALSRRSKAAKNLQLLNTVDDETDG
jgi:hypothetical protein